MSDNGVRVTPMVSLWREKLDFFNERRKMNKKKNGNVLLLIKRNRNQMLAFESLKGVELDDHVYGFDRLKRPHKKN